MHPATAAQAQLASLSGGTMGTSYTIRFVPTPELDVATVRREVEKRLETVNAQMSTYREDSELSRFNRYRGTEWFEVSEETAHVVAKALEVSRVTDGAFDVTVAPLVNLWNFGPEVNARQLPSAEAIDEALEHCGYEKLSVREHPAALKKSDPLLTVDLSAIAKGHGVDVVAEVLEETSYMVEIGGEVRTRGRKADGTKWTIGIEAPDEKRRRLHSRVRLSGEAMATSGGYRNFFKVDGKRYTHTIDPQTGRPVEHNLLAVSVVSETCLEADAWATAAMVLGPEAGREFLAARNAPALLLVGTGTGYTERMTPGFADLVAEPEAGRRQQLLVVFLAVLAIIGLAALGMSLGTLLKGRRLRGSCGGLSPDGPTGCDVCSFRTEECPENSEADDFEGAVMDR